MTLSQDESRLAQGVHENISPNDQHEVLKEVSKSSSATIVCTADSCSIPLHSSQSDEQSQHQESKKQKPSEGKSDPIAESDKAKTNKKKNRRNKKKNNNGGARSQQSVSSIQQIHTQSDLNKVLQQNDAVLLEFVTTWCTACHGIQPLYEDLAQHEMMETQPKANGEGGESMLRATQVICDKNKETKKLADANGVGSYPVFVLFEKGKQVNKWKGADVGKLEKVFDHYGAFGGGGKHGKGGKGKKGKGRRQ